ncbi:MAG: hypothetical protein UR85_C0005G0009 [Candidatus Nomurabacteria bacterium GW2011_GWF2_35_66]|uniref:WxL domain-containing protein n=1 Tax=Candidatus Nomurabacteria bacterium GW2011_GWE1_35_16 TaxID=1618761 RepID=A0A0G0DTU8_9BACT|nr:MAG: hypothetical protein UR55_C0006G0010 [Candidatus Nomurabacteria bacterium GW2011_GWF1_34_20]KKP63238.1 MAG: hypothetical protein UR57_C0007G0010 [Candidatus Nomurabacteria bacterium GW2011_GWE2_34_25]KKP66440.1 MAG: hypothetical protein UR64_C0007G0009 [Candidatus Nomurabacteria bacterium GW2011_GWE1_35_16]KKP83334.1 MAG: hypothetical protein UR85_C0005G0009 [Candidatus Nomurabacteria bacterium GW2011_GWF2_35_66]
MWIVISSFVLSQDSLADYMQSGTYRIQSDSLNFGGADSSSSNYKVNDTLGEIGTGDSNSGNYYMHAGYWQMQESYIAISSPSDLAMTSMGGLSGGSSEGTMSWVVTTDNTAGYTMSIASTTTPALKSAVDSLDDYTPAGADPDYNFTNLATNSSFGFSPEGTETTSRFKDNGVACNIGSSETTSKCWDGLSTTPKVIAGSTTSNQPSGSTVTTRFRAESGADHIQTSGAYNVTIVVTATTL